MVVSDVHCARCEARIGWRFGRDLSTRGLNANQAAPPGLRYRHPRTSPLPTRSLRRHPSWQEGRYGLVYSRVRCDELPPPRSRYGWGDDDDEEPVVVVVTSSSDDDDDD